MYANCEMSHTSVETWTGPVGVDEHGHGRGYGVASDATAAADDD